MFFLKQLRLWLYEQLELIAINTRAREVDNN